MWNCQVGGCWAAPPSASSTATRPGRMARRLVHAVALRRRWRACTFFGAGAAFYRLLPEGGRRAARSVADLSRCARVGSHRLAAVGRRLPLGLGRAAQGGRPGHLAHADLRRHRLRRRLRRRAAHAAGGRRRDAVPLPGRGGRGLCDEAGRRPLIDEVGELVCTQADAVDAAVLLGRPRRPALPRQLLRHVPRHLAPRRLDRASRRAAAPIIYGRSDATINRHGIRMGTARALPRGRGPARGARQPGGRPRIPRPRSSMPLFVVLRDGWRWTRR